MTSEVITRRKLSDQVVERLKALITSGDLAPGDAMPSERELMARFGVGRPAIREAMQALANSGLIVISHGERARVCTVTPRSILHQVETAARIMLDSSPAARDHLHEARRFFERGMVRAAAERAEPADLAALEQRLAVQQAALGDGPAFIAADMAFHARIAAISGNPIFEAVSEALLSWLQHYQRDLLLWQGQEQQTLAEHQAILARIAARDPDGAEGAMIAHLDRAGF